MAIDPSISLAVRPPVIAPLQIQTPLEKFAKIQTLRNLMNQGQLGQLNVQQTQLENEALQRNARDEQTLGSWMQQNGQRQDITPQEIVAAHPNPTGIKFATAWSAQQTAALTQRKAVLEAAHEEAKTDDRIYNSVVDDTSKMAALAELVRLKRIDGAMASHLTAIPFDSTEFKGIQQRATAQSLDRLQRIEAAKKEIDLRIAQATESSLTQKAKDEATKASQEVAGTQPITKYQQQQLDLSKVGKTEPVPEAVQRQRVEEAAAMAGAHANVLQTPEKIAQDLDIKKRELEIQSQANINKAMSGDASKIYAISTTLPEDLAQLREAFKKDYKGTVIGILSGTNANLAKIASNASDKVGRLRSGGAVNPSEEQRFMNAIASKSDVLFGNLNATLAALDRYERESNLVSEGLRPSAGGPKKPTGGGGSPKVKVWNEKTNRFEER